MNITVYCGANSGNSEHFRQGAQAVGQWIADNGHHLVYGGGKAGLMGVVADSVLAHGGKAIGIIPAFLQERELAHDKLTELYVVETMAERKAKMLELGDACLTLPGGAGTLEEIAEVFSWSRIGKNNKPCILFNQNGFYDSLKSLYGDMVRADFLSQTDLDRLLFSEDLNEIERFIAGYKTPEIRRY